MASIDITTAALTAFATLADLVNAAGNYRPTIRPDATDRRYEVLADAYDRAQRDRGDSRRAWRGGTTIGHRFEQVLSVRLQGVPAGSGQYSEWLKVVHAINAGHPDDTDKARYILGPIDTYTQYADHWFEEYPEYRVILRPDQSASIIAYTDRAADALSNAVLAVTGAAV